MRRFAEGSVDNAFISLNGHPKPIYVTQLGVLFKGDCLQLLPCVRRECVDMVFADPPFNIGKEYGRSVNDRKSAEEYIHWCKKWMDECIRVLKPGGSFFLYNIPKW